MILNMLKVRKQQRKEKKNKTKMKKERRKERSRTPMCQGGNEELTGKFNACNKWHKEDGMQAIKKTNFM